MGVVSTDNVVVRDVPDRHRYVATIGDTVAGFIDYHNGEQLRTFRHTVVASEFEGRGVGSALARAALDDVRAKHLKVRPACPFVSAWLQRHQDYVDLVTDDYLGEVRAAL